MQDQKKMWDEAHQKGLVDHYSTTPTEFAQEVLKFIPPHQKILELGCGVGNDSIAFARAGHEVVGTDFSEIAIDKNIQRAKKYPNVKFQVLDLTKPIPFDDEIFDIVYSRLSLHYFTDDITIKIFGEIYRVLKPEGALCFICKSTDDPLYAKGEKIEKDMYEYEGHIRHFFSQDYTKECLKNFEIKLLESGSERFYGSDSAFVKIIARRKKN